MRLVAMPDEQGSTNGASLRYLIALAGVRRVGALGVLLVAASLTEGLGLLMLVPLVQLFAGSDAVGAAATAHTGWLARLDMLAPWFLLLIVAGLVWLRAAIVHAANDSRRSLGLDITSRLRARAHGAIMRAEWRWLSRQGGADHAAAIMGEADRAGTLADRALNIAALMVTMAMLLLTALFIAPLLAGAVFAAGASLALPLLALRSHKGARAEAYHAGWLRLQRVVGDGIAKLRAARIAGASALVEAEFAAASDALRRHELDYFRTSSLLQMLFQMLAALLLASTIYLALFVWNTPLALFVPVLVIAIRCVPLAANVIDALRGWNHAMPALGGLRALIAEAKLHREPECDGTQRLSFCHAIELSHIYLHHPGRMAPILRDLDLTLPRGSIVAVTGPSGSGKSSLADLLCGLYAPDSGELRIDGIALDPSRRLAWRAQTAYLEQTPFFLDSTLAENLAWGLETIDPARITRALAEASADFVYDLALVLETRMGEGGRQFSGGEKQRIALARALLCEPDLLILDEVTASLDAANADAIRQSIAALRGRRTVLLMTHDPHLLALADSIIELGADG